jgi:hypothetical protein
MRSGIQMEAENLRTSVVAHSVKELARLYRLGEIEISVKDAFLFPQRPSQKATIRSDDATTARQREVTCGLKLLSATSGRYPK